MPPTDLSPRKQPKQRRAEERVETILAAYKRLLLRDAERISTNHIAEEAGVPVSSLYQYFPNRDALTHALYQQWAEEALAILQTLELAASEGRHWRQVLIDQGGVFFGSTEGAKLIQKLSPQMDTSKSLRAVRRKTLQQLTSVLASILQSLGSPWPLAALDNLAALLIELSTATYQHMATQTTVDAEQTMKIWQEGSLRMVEFCLTGPAK